MARRVAVALLLAGIVVPACAPPMLRTDVALLAEKIKPDTKILCVADFTAVRWHAEGVVVSADDSAGLGNDYIELIRAELKRKGFNTTSLGVPDINWMFEDGKKVPVVRGSRFRTMRPTLVRNLTLRGGSLIDYDSSERATGEETPLALQSAPSTAADGRLRGLVRATAQKASSALLVPPHLQIRTGLGTSGCPRQGEIDLWSKAVLEGKVAEPSELMQHCKPPDLMLLVWGNACATTFWQKVKRINWVSVALQGAVQAYSPVVHISWQQPTDSLVLRAVLLDPTTGTPLWFNSLTTVANPTSPGATPCPHLHTEAIVRRFLQGIPRAADLPLKKACGRPYLGDLN